MSVYRKGRIVFVLEIFNREITSVILLKKELEKRGYSVSIKRKSEDLCHKSCDVLIVPNGYMTSSYNDYRYRFYCETGKIINLQWEQLHTRYEEEHDLWLADGKAKKLVFLCWGDNRVDQLKNVGVKDYKVFKVGPIHTDTMRETFKPIWLGREEIAHKYGLDQNKQWLLFISSMTYAPDDSPFINSQKVLANYMDYDKRHILEKKTQKEIIMWFEILLKKNKELIVVYRPHPTEMESDLLNQAIKKYGGRFKVICELDLKQWITVSDILVIWNSTSAIECSMTGKKCIIVRPYEMEYDEEYVLYDDAKMARTYQEFEDSVLDSDNIFPINQEKLRSYYNIENTPSYIRIADVINKIYKEDQYNEFENHYKLHRFMFLVSKGIYVKLALKSIYCLLHDRIGFTIKNRKLRERFFVDSWEKSINERKKVDELEKTIKMSY